jgi:hypothetical protein
MTIRRSRFVTCLPDVAKVERGGCTSLIRAEGIVVIAGAPIEGREDEFNKGCQDFFHGTYLLSRVQKQKLSLLLLAGDS